MTSSRQESRSVLFVCTGNIARSPFMELTLSQHLADTSAAALPIKSAGTYALAHSGVHPSVAEELDNRGIDSSGFTTTQLSSQLAHQAGLILTATRDHRRLVARLAPERRNVTFTLRQFVRLIQLDPVGEIRVATNGPLEALAQLANRNRGLSGGSQDDDDIVDPVNSHRRLFPATFAAIDPAISLLAELITGLKDLSRDRA